MLCALIGIAAALVPPAGREREGHLCRARLIRACADPDSRPALLPRPAPPTLLRSSKRAEGDLEGLLSVEMRFEGFFTLLRGLKKNGLSSEIRPGCMVIARQNIEASNIFEWQAYELQQVAAQPCAPHAAARPQVRWLLESRLRLPAVE